MLGYRFSPRIADIGGTGFRRADLPGVGPGDYGPLNAIARNKVSFGRVVTYWPDILRIAGSLVTNRIRADARTGRATSREPAVIRGAVALSR